VGFSFSSPSLFLSFSFSLTPSFSLSPSLPPSLSQRNGHLKGSSREDFYGGGPLKCGTGARKPTAQLLEELDTKGKSQVVDVWSTGRGQYGLKFMGFSVQ